MNREITVTISYGDLEVTIAAEAVSWSGDVASDLMGRALAGFGTALALIRDNVDEES